MLLRSALAFTALSFSSAAFAAADLSTSISQPSGTMVYATARYTVKVKNVGNQTASSSTVVIQLPVTATSPTVHVMGTVIGKSSTCSQSGTKLTCTLGSIAKNTTKSVYVDLQLPESTNNLDITATASTTSSESNLSNNAATLTASLYNPTLAFTGPRTVLNEHCTGTSLSAYFECTLYPSSISDHEAVLEAGGTLSFPAYGPDYGGTWSTTSDSLTFTITELGVPVAEFEGYAVDGSCWEGITHFLPSSPYMSPYRVCLQ